MALGVTQREGLDGAWLPLGLGEKPEGECCLSALRSPGIPPSELRGKKGCSFTKRLLCTGTVQSRHGNREVEPEGNRWEKTPQSSGWDLSTGSPNSRCQQSPPRSSEGRCASQPPKILVLVAVLPTSPLVTAPSNLCHHPHMISPYAVSLYSSYKDTSVTGVRVHPKDLISLL